MTDITLCNIEPELETLLHQRAANTGRSIADEALHTLRHALQQDPQQRLSLATVIQRRFANIEVGSLDFPERERS